MTESKGESRWMSPLKFRKAQNLLVLQVPSESTVLHVTLLPKQLQSIPIRKQLAVSTIVNVT